MRARRPRAGLRGWGGVAAMAVVCALTAVFALLLPHAGPSGASREGGAGAGPAGAGTAGGTRVRAGEDCAAPEEQTLSPSDADGPAIDAIKNRRGEKRKLVVGVDQNSYGWGYRDPNRERGTAGDLEGFDIDLVHRIAEDILGDADAVQFKAIPTDQRIPAVRDGRVDMVVRTMTITCERVEDVAFSAPYFRTGQQVLAPRSSGITGYDDSLAGRRICTAAGSTAHAALEEGRGTGDLPASADISTTVPSQLDCLVRLQLGEADAVVTDGALAASQAAQDPTVQLKGEAFTTEYYGVAMRKDAHDLVRRVNHILADYREDTSDGWQASYERWLSRTLREDSADSEPPAPRYRRES